MKSAAILGASGYGGGELIRLIDGHPELDVTYLGAHSQAGKRLGEVHPQLGDSDRILEQNTADLDGIDIVFLALPHGASAHLASELAGRGVTVVDLGSDFRMDTADRYEAAYGTPHPFPDQLADWTYGLPELVDVGDTSKVASPGCYPTATLLGLAPLLAAGAVGFDGIVVNAVSGVSGAGRSLSENLLFGAVAEGVAAYGVTTHRHRPEIEMALEAYTGRAPIHLTFTPHLVPMLRGIHATITVPVSEGVTANDLRGVLVEFGDGKPFYQVVPEPPQTRWATGSNRAIVSVYLDEQTGNAVILSVIDNLLKGAAGQAVQAANLMLGFDEAAGLPTSGWMP